MFGNGSNARERAGWPCDAIPGTMSGPLDLSEQEEQGSEEEQDGEFAPGHRLLRQRMVADDALAALLGHLGAIGATKCEEIFMCRLHMKYGDAETASGVSHPAPGNT